MKLGSDTNGIQQRNKPRVASPMFDTTIQVALATGFVSLCREGTEGRDPDGDQHVARLLRHHSCVGGAIRWGLAHRCCGGGHPHVRGPPKVWELRSDWIAENRRFTHRDSGRRRRDRFGARNLAWLPWLTVSSMLIGYGDTSINIVPHTCTWYIHDQMDTEMNFLRGNGADGAVYTQGDDLSTYTHVHRHVSHISICPPNRVAQHLATPLSPVCVCVGGCSGVWWQPG